MFTEEQPQVSQDALSVLHNLLRSIPTFWTAGELTQVIGLHLDFCGSPGAESAMAPLVKAIAKRASSKTVLLTMSELWPSLHQNVSACSVPNSSFIFNTTKQARSNVFIGYFDTLKKALHSAPRPIILEHLRPLFKVFLEALEVVSLEVSANYKFRSRSLLSQRRGRDCCYLIILGNRHQIKRVLLQTGFPATIRLGFCTGDRYVPALLFTL